ncbi:MAG: AbrB/MazE/SpoVT family DNA-binding domain-containing protein [Coriobacteriia bacterium]|nr:AbrB/MazE/SpoVT family DNA-binding domain-containing protein [Coriobacteriia bacterium]
MPQAKITSKGQVTIPAEVREALGLKQGDMLVFEVQAEYAVVRKRPSITDIAEKYAYLFEGKEPRYATKDEALAAYFRDLEPDDLAEEPILAQPKRLRGGQSE